MARVAEDTEQHEVLHARSNRTGCKGRSGDLEENTMPCVVCSNLKDLVDRLNIGAAVAVVTEEPYFHSTSDELNVWVKRQPPWSDFPFPYSPAIRHRPLLKRIGCACWKTWGMSRFCKHQFGAVTLVSTVQQLCARRRQYERFGSICSLGKMPPLQLEGLVQDPNTAAGTC